MDLQIKANLDDVLAVELYSCLDEYHNSDRFELYLIDFVCAYFDEDISSDHEAFRYYKDEEIKNDYAIVSENVSDKASKIAITLLSDSLHRTAFIKYCDLNVHLWHDACDGAAYDAELVRHLSEILQCFCGYLIQHDLIAFTDSVGLEKAMFNIFDYVDFT